MKGYIIYFSALLTCCTSLQASSTSLENIPPLVNKAITSAAGKAKVKSADVEILKDGSIQYSAKIKTPHGKGVVQVNAKGQLIRSHSPISITDIPESLFANLEKVIRAQEVKQAIKEVSSTGTIYIVRTKSSNKSNTYSITSAGKISQIK